MRYRTHGRSSLETRVDYVESKLDDTINNFKEAMQKLESKHDESRRDLKEAIRDYKEAMQQMESRHKESVADIKEMVRDNKASLEKVVSKAESSRRWAIGTVVTIAVAVIGFLAAAVGFLLTNGFQVQL